MPRYMSRNGYVDEKAHWAVPMAAARCPHDDGRTCYDLDALRAGTQEVEADLADQGERADVDKAVADLPADQREQVDEARQERDRFVWRATEALQDTWKRLNEEATATFGPSYCVDLVDTEVGGDPVLKVTLATKLPFIKAEEVVRRLEQGPPPAPSPRTIDA